MAAFKIKPKDDAVTKSVRMPGQMAEKLNAIAEENNLSFTDALLQCIEYALSNMEDRE